MDLGTELDYEEEDDLKWCDDEYLRIDLSEEEENFFSGETASEKPQKTDKVYKKSEGSHQQVASSEKAQTNSLGESNGDCHGVTVDNVQRKECQNQLQTNSTKTWSYNCRLPAEQFSNGLNAVKPPVLSMCNGQRLCSERFLSNENATVEPLLSLNGVNQEQNLQPFRNKRFRPVQTFNSHYTSRFPVPSRTLFQQRNGPFVTHSASGINNDFQNEERKKFCRDPTWKDAQSKVEDECIKRSDILPKPEISKEWLLKKRNPFDTTTEVTDRIPVAKVKEECPDSKPFDTRDTLHHRLKEEGKTSVTNCKGLHAAVKPEAESQVKFVRTVSKSFVELTQRNGCPSQSLRTFPFSEGILKGSSPVEDSPQVRYHVRSRIF